MGEDLTEGIVEEVSDSNSLGEKHAESSVTKAEV
jgi:hypothetical protein